MGSSHRIERSVSPRVRPSSYERGGYLALVMDTQTCRESDIVGVRGPKEMAGGCFQRKNLEVWPSGREITWHALSPLVFSRKLEGRDPSRPSVKR